MKYHIGELSCLSICHQIKVPITVSRLYTSVRTTMLDTHTHTYTNTSNSYIHINYVLFTLQLITMADFLLPFTKPLAQFNFCSATERFRLRLRRRLVYFTFQLRYHQFISFFLFPFFLLLPSGEFLANLQAYTTQTFIPFFLIAKVKWFCRRHRSRLR